MSQSNWDLVVNDSILQEIHRDIVELRTNIDDNTQQSHNVVQQVNELQNKVDNILSYLKENRNLYTDIMNKTNEILERQRESFVEILQKIYDTENRNMQEIKEKLNDVPKYDLFKAIGFEPKRLENFYWRTTMKNSQKSFENIIKNSK